MKPEGTFRIWSAMASQELSSHRSTRDVSKRIARASKNTKRNRKRLRAEVGAGSPDWYAFAGFGSVLSVVAFVRYKVDTINKARAELQRAKDALSELKKAQVEGKATTTDVENAEKSVRAIREKEEATRTLLNVGPVRVNLTPPGIGGIAVEEQQRTKQASESDESIIAAAARIGVMFALVGSSALALAIILLAITLPRG